MEGKLQTHQVFNLQQVISDTIASDPFNYNDAILGQDPDEYRRWIVQQNSWGGAIELSIFSDHYQTEIHSIDIKTLRADKFGEGKYSKRVLILYNGIHYDAIALSPIEDGPLDFDQTTFDCCPAGSDSDHLLQSAIKLASILKAKKKFTDLAGFTLSCGICKKNLVGQKDGKEGRI
jgi:ubiquitin thioesterase OTU1